MGRAKSITFVDVIRQPPLVSTLSVSGRSLITLARCRIIKTNLWTRATSYFMDGGWLLSLPSCSDGR